MATERSTNERCKCWTCGSTLRHGWLSVHATEECAGRKRPDIFKQPDLRRAPGACSVCGQEMKGEPMTGICPSGPCYDDMIERQMRILL